MGNIINRVFESAGPDGKVRGTPQQIIDKYQALARDAQVSGDRVAAESFLQYSEHYTRILGEAQRQQMENRYQGERDDNQQQREDGFDRRPQQQPQPQAAPMPSGLAMIDSDDSDDFGGPIETPENRRMERRDPLPMSDPAPQPAFEPPAFLAAPMPAAMPSPAPAPVEAPVIEAAEPAAEPVAEPVAEASVEAPVRKPRARKRKPAAEVISDAPAAEAAAPEAPAAEATFPETPAFQAE